MAPEAKTRRKSSGKRDRAVSQAAPPISPLSSLDAREYLGRVFQARRNSADGSYSYRQYAFDLGFGRTNYLHLILQGARAVSVKAARQIGTALGFSAVEKQYFEALAEHGQAETPGERERWFARLLDLKSSVLASDLGRAQLEYFSEWYHSVVREMIRLDNFCADPKWISEHIVPAISLEQAAHSLELLERIGYIHKNEGGTLKLAAEHVRTPAEVRSIAIIRYHQQMIERGKESMLHVPPGERDIGSVTLSVSEARASEIKAEVQAFRAKLLAMETETDAKEKVVQVNIQMFPFSRRSD